MRTIETALFKFDELSDSAKEKAREWFRAGALDFDWWDAVYDDAANIADKIGIDLRQRQAKLMGGGTRNEPSIFFSGFSSQGDGACFEGEYRYRKGSAKNVKSYAPQDAELHRIASELADIQRRHLYGITATVKHVGRYSHENSTEIDVDFGAMEYNAETADAVAELLRDFMRWIYRQLEREYEWRMSDECVDDDIENNEYEFTEDGSYA